MRKVRVGLVGCGTVFRTHLQQLREMKEIEIAAVCDIDESKRLPDCGFYTDYHEMARQETLDAVHICLPHYLHEDAARTFAAAGIAVLCEKPVGMNLEQCARMAQLEQQYGVMVAVCMQNRWNRTFCRLQELLREPESGKLLGIKAIAAWNRTLEYYQASPWRGEMAHAGGGCMMNQAVHTLDLMLCLGGEVASVSGQICRLSGYPIEVEDTACASITFANGCKGLFFGSVVNASNASIEIEVYCEHVTYCIKDYTLWRSAPGSSDRERILSDDVLAETKAYYGAGHRALIHDFYRALAGAGGHYVTVESASRVIRLIEDIGTSSARQAAVEF